MDNQKYYKINTYGCQMNVHESEKIAAILEGIEYNATNEDNLADVIVFNTCCIRDTAEKRVYGNVGALKPLKKVKNELIIAVVGCVTQQSGAAELLKKKFPFVDIILGTSNINELGAAVENIRKEKSYVSVIDSTISLDNELTVARTSFPNAWINIMYGCNNFCTYCIVPY
ncbi:MAG: tRNA (N6-isopentenyl adenosine(37)-C2)-methylthiotransferase MiaB, partial [Clostridia bacterium]|nr:tRNA (N6-isopentenyl adenosine(37)-C2)-methylthiotransferase MiaB [Clostridia bacterium]